MSNTDKEARKRDKKADREERERRRQQKRAQRERAEAAVAEAEGGAGAAWSILQGLLGIRLSCCAQISACSSAQSIISGKLADAEHRRDKEREERREKRREERRQQRREERKQRREKKEGKGEDKGNAADVGKATSERARRAEMPRRKELRRDDRSDVGSEAGSDGSGGSARSSCSRASASSYASSYASESSYASSKYSERSRNASKSAPPPRLPIPMPTGSSTSGVKVLNLGDLQGAKLEDLQAPAVSEAKSDAAWKPAPAKVEPKEEDPPLSARSGRSEGAASMKSVASTRIHHFQEGLSGPKKSSSEIKKLVKDFVREMVKGREMNVLCQDGSMVPVKAGITKALDTLRMKSQGTSRNVLLADVETCITGESEELSDLETPLDDCCATLVLNGSECISFKFAEQKRAELFTLCMNLFIDGLRKKK
eukprot:TRINITY_DN77465_c0_g1_i1.p1 TRINITY_DN77465_c0_g1~~TRINITY_DN77465_c0_g1_i1.p1  ORF type:complete len:428 (-),score=104.42 TRINITY_DN77465_c0_g1_i1:43-1326(-)